MKIFYIYDSHLGGVYVTDRELTRDEEYCDQCGDFDVLIFSGSVVDIHEHYENQITCASRWKTFWRNKGNMDKECDYAYDLECLLIEYKQVLDELESQGNRPYYFDFKKYED